MVVTERETQILTEARALVALEGVESLTMRRLGRRSQIAAAGIYHYFRSRDDLVDHLHREVFGEYQTQLGAPPKDLAPASVATWLSGGQPWLAEHAELTALTAECITRSDSSPLPAEFFAVLLGGVELRVSPEVDEVKPSLMGSAALSLLRAASLPKGCADLPGLISSLRDFHSALSAVPEASVTW